MNPKVLAVRLLELGPQKRTRCEETHGLRSDNMRNFHLREYSGLFG